MGCRAEGYLSWWCNSCVQRGAKRDVAIYDGCTMIKCSTWTEAQKEEELVLTLRRHGLHETNSTCLHQMLLPIQINSAQQGNSGKRCEMDSEVNDIERGPGILTKWPREMTQFARDHSSVV